MSNIVHRDASGRFKKGSSGNPRGRGPRKVEEEYVNVTYAQVTPEEWGALVRRVFESAAKTLDMRKVEWLGRHFVGDPSIVHQYNLSLTKQEITIKVRFGDEDENLLPAPEDVIEAEILELEEE